MPQYWREKTLLIKTETVYGTDPVPTGAANAILATDITVNPMEGQDVDRNLDMPWMGNSASIVAGKYAKIAFKIELKGSGAAGTPPAFGPLLRACAMAEVIVAATSVTYNRVSTAHSSVTIYFNVDGTLFKMRGARGNVVQRVTAQGIVYLEFEFTGLYDGPAAQAKPTPTLGTQLSAFPQVASSANTPIFTIGGTAHALRSFSLNLGNQVEPRLLINQEEIIIARIAEQAECTINAVPLATLNPFSLADSNTPQAMVLQHGVGAGKICTLNIPRALFQRPGSPTQQQGIVEWPLRMVPLPDTGNDQFTLAFT